MKKLLALIFLLGLSVSCAHKTDKDWAQIKKKNKKEIVFKNYDLPRL